MAFTLTSPAFANGHSIPVGFTCDGDDSSPPLQWQHPPAGTMAFALVVDDPDAPSGTFTHWLLCDIPGDLTTLEEGMGTARVGAAGTNDFGNVGYGGPCPPKGHGLHHYRFRLHALGRPAGLEGGFTREDLDAALRGHVLGTATLTGT